MNSVLVTGGAGYVGSHACKVLAHAGYTPICYDNLERGHACAVKWGPLEKGNILDRKRLDEVLQKYKPEAVMHFAAYAYVDESVAAPEKYYRNNVAGTLGLLEAMHDHGINKIIFSSSCATYGIPQQVPITEAHPQDPINPYGASKLVIERMLKDFDTAYGIRSISLRYFNAAGADPDGEIGEDHDPETHLIPLALLTAAGKQSCLHVYGSDYDTPDGTCIRDYIHVTDLADAHVLALKALEAGSGTTAYNLGNGNGFSVIEVIECAKKIAGKPIPVKIVERRAGDPPILVANSETIKTDLAWLPKYTDIGVIIQTAWNWHNR